jgi:hypothetical protein
MKWSISNIWRICALCLSFHFVLASAQIERPIPVVRVVKFNPLSLLAQRFVVGYEQTINTKLSWGGTLGLIGGTRTELDDTLLNSCRGLFIQPAMRYYFDSKAPDGLYLAGVLRYYNVREKQKDLVHSYNSSQPDFGRTRVTSSAGIGLFMGYQFPIKKFTIDISGGLLQNTRRVTTSYNDPKANDFDFDKNRVVVTKLDHDGLGFRLALSVGYKI